MQVPATKRRISGQLEASPERGAGADFESFFAEHHPALFRALWLLTRSREDAEEIAQEAFVRVWERWDRVVAMENPAGYLYRIAMNGFRSRFRRATRALIRGTTDGPADRSLEIVEERDGLVRRLGMLPTRQRAAVLLVDVLDFTSDQAARILRIRPATVRVLAARGRATLREAISGE